MLTIDRELLDADGYPGRIHWKPFSGSTTISVKGWCACMACMLASTAL